MPRPVLVADDSPVARLAIARRLRTVGLDVVEQTSARDARSVDPSSIACALLDLELGDGSGADVALDYRARRPDLPVSFFTSNRDEGAVALAATFGPVFRKPDELDEVVAWVSTHAER